MSIDTDGWVDVVNEPPTVVGWYATVTCWDAREGLFPGMHYWNGQPFPAAVVMRSPIAFSDKASAETWAYEHDPERP